MYMYLPVYAPAQAREGHRVCVFFNHSIPYFLDKLVLPLNLMLAILARLSSQQVPRIYLCLSRYPQC